VSVFEADLVDVCVRVSLVVVGVLVYVLDVVVGVLEMRVGVGHIAVRVLVRVGGRCGGHVFSSLKWVSGVRRSGARVGADVRRARCEVLEVAERLVDERGDVRVVQAVHNVASGPGADDESKVPEHPQLVGHRRLLHLQGCPQLPDSARVDPQQSEDADPAGGRECSQHSCDLGCVLER
jgi:hypothetical protein